MSTKVEVKVKVEAGYPGFHSGGMASVSLLSVKNGCIPEPILSIIGMRSICWNLLTLIGSHTRGGSLWTGASLDPG